MRIVHNPVPLLKSEGKNVRFFKYRDTNVKRDDHCAGSVSTDAVYSICSRDTGFFLIKNGGSDPDMQYWYKAGGRVFTAPGP